MSQIKKKFIEDNAVGAAKIRLENDSALKARNNADSGDVDLIKLNTSDEVVITGLIAPSNNTDAATKLYVDDFSASLAAYIGDVEADVIDLVTLSGVASGSEDLGAFTGSIIPDGSTIKEALQALETDLESIPDPLYYAGTYDATTNTPALSNGDTGVSGALYQVTVAGTQDFGAGPISFEIGDKVVNNGTIWEKWDHTDAVNSVNGQTGVVQLDADNIPYDNAVSGLTAIDVQAAIDEVAAASVDAANKTLSNLTSPTEINQHLLPDTTNTRNLGSASLLFSEVHGSVVYGGGGAALIQLNSPRGQSEATLSGTNGGLDLAVATGNRISSIASRQISLQTGNTVDGNSGDILLRTGVPSGSGLRGKIDLLASELDMNASKIVDLADPTNAQDAATKAYVDTAVGAASAYRKEQIQLSGGQITAQAVTLAETPLANSIMVFAGGLCQLEGIDFSLSGSTVTFLGDLATGGAAELVAGDYLVISYAY